MTAWWAIGGRWQSGSGRRKVAVGRGRWANRGKGRRAEQSSRVCVWVAKRTIREKVVVVGMLV